MRDARAGASRGAGATDDTDNTGRCLHETGGRHHRAAPAPTGRHAIVLRMLEPRGRGLRPGVCCVALLVLAVAAPRPCAGQAEPRGSGDWVASRTPDGQPDIQGVWTNATMTPLERPADLAGKPFFSEAEAAALERAAQEQREQAFAPGAVRIERLPPGSRFAGYNAAIWSGTRSIAPTRRTSMVVDPPSGRVPLRPEAESRRDYLVAHRSDTYENMSVYTRCITRGVPGALIPNFYNAGNHILQAPGYVVILTEMIGEARIIPLDDRPPLDPAIGLWMGDSRGRWEGETLVVETTNFDDRGWITPNQNAGRMHGVPVSRTLRVVERFTRVSEDVLDWRATVEDPSFYTAPWTLELPLTRDPSYDLYEYACHEGNYAVPNLSLIHI